jgi:hypothetical protein
LRVEHKGLKQGFRGSGKGLGRRWAGQRRNSSGLSSTYLPDKGLGQGFRVKHKGLKQGFRGSGKGLGEGGGRPEKKQLRVFIHIPA